MSECLHGLDEGMCSLCASPPTGVNPMVWITWGGTHFHNDPNCLSLDSGQADADERGDNVHRRKQVSWTSIQMERSRCKTCVPRIR